MERGKRVSGVVVVLYLCACSTFVNITISILQGSKYSMKEQTVLLMFVDHAFNSLVRGSRISADSRPACLGRGVFKKSLYNRKWTLCVSRSRNSFLCQSGSICTRPGSSESWVLCQS